MSTRRAHLGRYLLWQLRDYLVQQAPATMIVLCLFGYLTIAPVLHGVGGTLAALPASVHQRLLAEFLASFVLLGTLFATNGIVSTDRKHGFYRFLFAKPVSAPRFYTNAFVANGVGMLLVGLFLLGLYSALVHPSWTASFVPVVAAMYVAYGGVGFLLSTVWRYDWLSLVTVAVVASIGWELWGDDAGIRGWLVHLLPPTHKAGEVYAYVAGAATAFPWATMIWLVGYGFTCFVLGLVVLRRRSLATA
jgi:hypothetical protein